MYYQDMQDPKKNPELLRPLPTCVAQQDAFVELLFHVPEIDHLSVLYSKLGKSQCFHNGHGLHCEKPALPI